MNTELGDLLDVIINHPISKTDRTNRETALVQCGNFHICSWQQLLDISYALANAQRKLYRVRDIVDE